MNKNVDQVTSVKVPATTGFENQSYNTSEQINNGIEILLSATALKFKDFSWRLSANLAYNYNELIKYVSPTGNILSDMYVGYPLGKIFTGKTTGISAETGLYEFELRPDITISTIDDYKKYQNYLFYVGTSNAPVNGGISTSLIYKRLTLSMAGNFSIGGKILNNIVSPADYGKVKKTKNEPIPSSKNDLYVNYLNVNRNVRNRWTPSNPITDGYPRLIDAYGPRLKDGSGNLLALTRLDSQTISQCTLLEDVSYFKLSSLSLSYMFPSKWARAIHVADIGASFLMNNLFIITNYSGIDPETPGAVYPQSRSYSFSLSISF